MNLKYLNIFNARSENIVVNIHVAAAVIGKDTARIELRYYAAADIVEMIITDSHLLVGNITACVNRTHIGCVTANLVEVVIFYNIVNAVEGNYMMLGVIEIVVVNDIAHTVQINSRAVNFLTGREVMNTAVCYIVSCRGD